MEGESKVHLVDWETVCKNKEDGGLGIRKSCSMNQALLVKAAWKIYSRNQGNWASILRSKYLKNDISTLDFPKVPNASHAWRRIRVSVSLAKSEVRWVVRDGSKIRFWLDDWTSEGPLLEKATCPLSNSNKLAKVSLFLNEFGWNLDILNTVLPVDIIHKISTIYIGTSVGQSDAPYCQWDFLC